VSLLRARALHLVLGLVLGGVFLYAAFPKIVDPRSFAKIVYHYQLIGPSALLPPMVPNAFAVSLPFVEAVVGVLLLVGVWRREAAWVATLLLAVFVLAVSTALVRGIDIENCGCFSVTGKGRSAGLRLLVEDTALLAAAVCLAGVEPRRSPVRDPRGV
jgi:uncharacterized membrane protein YphA (DoxX/SURF4 family)